MKKNIDILFVFLSTFLYSLFLFSKTCRLYLQNGFDYQALFIWDYNAAIGMIPYKDVFYPYGILSYYKDHILLAHILYLCILPITLTILYICLKKVFQSLFLAGVTFFFFCLFVQTFTGWEVFNRYGVLLVLSLYFTQYLYEKNFYKVRELVSLGASAGLCFAFITDIGIYSAFIFILLLVMGLLLKKNKKSYQVKSYWQDFLKQTIYFAFGFGIGSIPLFIYLLKTHTFFDFLHSLLQLSDIALYAKTPFLPSLHSIENIFVFVLLFSTVCFLYYTFIFQKKAVSLLTHYEFVLVVVIILLEQKNIIRSIDRTITFVGFLLLCFLLHRLITFLTETKRLSVGIESMYSIILLCLSFSTGYLIWAGPLSTHTYNPSVVRVFSDSDMGCVQQNVANFHKNPSYKKVQEILKKQPDFNGKIFSFPFDPVFYAFLDQKTPYYSNTYDSSSSNAQQKQIQFIQEEKIQYVVINMDITAMQDEVPEYLRANLLVNYILNHYEVVTREENFLVLQQKTLPQDILTNTLVPKTYKNYLLSLDLKHIPLSEGRSKYEQLQKNQVDSFSTFEKLNQYAKQQVGVIPTSILAIFFSQHLKQENELIDLTIHRSDGVVSHIRFKTCAGDSPCIINLSRIPLFFLRNKNDSFTFSSSARVKRMQLFQNGENIVW